MMAIDELLERADEARARRDTAATELTALIKALDGMAGIDMLDSEQTRHLAALKKRPARRARSTRRRRAS